MENSSQIFTSVASKVTSTALFAKILQKQQNIYEIQYYKIENSEGQTMLKIYASINSRRQLTKQCTIDQESWNENQRRVFVWFIICYTYFLELEKKQITPDTYKQLSRVFFDKNPSFLHFQHLNLFKTKNRISWTLEEDELLANCTNELQTAKWNQISKKIFYNSNCRVFKSPKHCRERWLNHLDTKKKHGGWSSQEDLVIFQYVLSNGKKWSKIVPLLNQTRTEHMIKNRYNSLICKSKHGKKVNQQDVAKIILYQLQGIQMQGQSEKIKTQLNSSVQLEQKAQNLKMQNMNTNNLYQQDLYYVNSMPMEMNNNLFNSNFYFLPQFYLSQNMVNFSQIANLQSQSYFNQMNTDYSLFRQ